MFVLEGDTLQFAVFIEALRSNLSDICSEYQSRQFFIVLESFCCNFRYFKGIAIFRNGCRNGDLISFFLVPVTATVPFFASDLVTL